MFKVGERRKPSKSTPGVLRISILRADSLEIDEETRERNAEFPYSYALVHYKAHDDQRTQGALKNKSMVQVPGADPEEAVNVVWNGRSDEFSMDLDIPHHGYQDDVEIQMWDSKQQDEALDDEIADESNRDRLVGTLKIPVPWVINGFGGGYAVSSEQPGYFRMVLEGSRPRSYPYELAIKLSYRVEEEHSLRASRRWTSFSFNGTYVLDRSRSDNIEPLLKAVRMPFILRKLYESGYEETLEVAVGSGGNTVNMSVETPFYRESTGPMKVDELFQSVKTFRGEIHEKRLYWDFSSMGRITKGEAYPSAILVTVTRPTAENAQVVEAWDLSKDGRLLTQLSMVNDQKFRRVWVRTDAQELTIRRHPKVATRSGTLVVAVLGARDLTPDFDDPPVCAFASLKVVSFENNDVRYQNPLDEDEAREEMTEVHPNQVSPVWNQVFQFPIEEQEDVHHVLVVEVWNREDEEEALIGSLHIPVPFIFNACASSLGPAAFSSSQVTFKLKRGQSLDPTQKVKYGGGLIELKTAFQVANL